MSTTGGLGVGLDIARHDIGAVLALGQDLVEDVGGALVAHIDAGAADILLLEGVGVQADEQIRLVLPGEVNALVEGQIGVVVAGQRHVELPRCHQQVAQLQGKGQRDVLFVHAARGAGAIVDAAMAGVDHHQRAAALGRPVDHGRGDHGLGDHGLGARRWLDGAFGGARCRLARHRRRRRLTGSVAGNGAGHVAIDRIGEIGGGAGGKILARRGHQIDHQPGRLVADGVEHIGLLHRPRAWSAAVRCGRAPLRPPSC